MIGSPEINKVIRRVLTPVVKQNGFSHVQGRNYWGWHGPCTWVLNVRAVGNYFSLCTDWPSMSLGVSLGVWYDFIPKEMRGSVKISQLGLPLPDECGCQRRLVLRSAIDQSEYTQLRPTLSEPCNPNPIYGGSSPMDPTSIVLSRTLQTNLWT